LFLRNVNGKPSRSTRRFAHWFGASCTETAGAGRRPSTAQPAVMYLSLMGEIPWYFFVIGGVAFVLTIGGVIAWNKYIENDDD
jgi:hypothetical protein